MRRKKTHLKDICLLFEHIYFFAEAAGLHGDIPVEGVWSVGLSKKRVWSGSISSL